MNEDEGGVGLNRPTNESLQKAGSYLAKFISGPATTLSGIVDDHLRHVRFRRSASLAVKTMEHLQTLGYAAPPRPVPLKIIVPLLQSATLEENDNLQNIWAALLANASTLELGEFVSVSFVEMLRSMGSLEVKILSQIHASRTGSPKDVFCTQDLPDKAILYDGVSKIPHLPATPVQTAIWNLIRLGCLTAESTSSGSGKAIFVAVTALGETFIRACTVSPKDG